MLKLHRQGIIASLASATPADVFPGSSGLYPFPASALATTIVSSSVNDATAGTGALTAKVSGLDANFMEISEIIALNGTTPVSLVNTYLRINLVEILTAGSDGVNDGTISVKQGSAVVGIIAVSANRSQSAIYTASGNRPCNAVKKLYFNATNEVVGGVTFTVYTRKNLPSASPGVWQIRHVSTVYGTTMPSDHVDLASPIYLDQGEDIRISATSNAAATALAAGFDLWEGSTSEFNQVGLV